MLPQPSQGREETNDVFLSHKALDPVTIFVLTEDQKLLKMNVDFKR